MRYLTLLLLLAVAGCTAPRPAATSGARNELMSADRAFAAATAQDGLEGWMRAYAADAVRLQLGGPAAQGHAAIREFDAGLFADPTVRLTWAPSDAGVFRDGRHGFTTGRGALVRMSPTADTLWRGSYITFWRKEGDRWMVILDTGASD